MDSLFFTNNDHMVLGMYFITPFVMMFGLSIIADLFSSSRKLAQIPAHGKAVSGYFLHKPEHKHSRFRKIDATKPSQN